MAAIEWKIGLSTITMVSATCSMRLLKTQNDKTMIQSKEKLTYISYQIRSFLRDLGVENLALMRHDQRIVDLMRQSAGGTRH